MVVGLPLNVLAIFLSASCNHRLKFNFLWSITGSHSVVATLTQVQDEQSEVRIPAGAGDFLFVTTPGLSPGLTQRLTQ